VSRKGLRLLWMSNAPHVGSGYGVQANSLLPRLSAMSDVEEVGIFGYFGIQGGLTELPVGRGIPGIRPMMMKHYPLATDIWGQDVIWEHAQHFEADAVVSLLDVWVFNEDFGDHGFLWLPYSPVDHDPIPPMISERLKRAFHPLCYSQHASAEYSRVGLTHSYVPLGVETSVFRPMTRRTKMAAKRWLDMPTDSFVIGLVAANKGWPSRKGFPELMEAFAIFNERHPDSYLYLHSVNKDPLHPGPDLLHLGRTFGISDHLRLTHPYLLSLGFSMQEMAKLYQAFDVFCLPSMGEGFGIPIIEAQACGVPVIVSDWTACSELCGSGWTVPIGKKFLTTLDSFMAFVDVPALAESMEQSYLLWKTQKDTWENLTRDARTFALKYDWSVVVKEKWAPLMSWLADITHPIAVPGASQEDLRLAQKTLSADNGSQPDSVRLDKDRLAEPVPLGSQNERGAPLPLRVAD